MAAPVKMDELLVSWLGSDDVYDNVLKLIEEYRVQRKQQEMIQRNKLTPPTSPKHDEKPNASEVPPRNVLIPMFHPLKTNAGKQMRRRRSFPSQFETWEPFSIESGVWSSNLHPRSESKEAEQEPLLCVRDQVLHILPDLQIIPSENSISFPLESFVRITKEVCRFPMFFNAPLYQRILNLWNTAHQSDSQASVVTLNVLEWFWKTEMEPFDPAERFFRLVKQPHQDCILRDDFLPFIKALLNDHPVSANSAFVSVFQKILCLNHSHISLGIGVLIQSRRIPREVCSDRHHQNFLFHQQMPLRAHHVSSDP